jgi:hypothetical protein
MISLIVGTACATLFAFGFGFVIPVSAAVGDLCGRDIATATSAGGLSR